jgi:DNA-binding transcriptional LysR family regulator
MKIDPRHLLQIAAIVDRGTFSAAAESLGTSQPALSRIVTLLERRLGALLFDRESRPPKPTEAGLSLAEQGRAIRAATDHAAIALDRISKGEFGKIRIGAPPFLADHLLPEALCEFLPGHPRIQIELISDFFPALQAKLLMDDIDMIVGPVTLVDRSQSFIIHKLLDDSNVVVCRAGHPLGRKRKIRSEDLEQSNWISYSTASTLHSDMQAALTSAGVNQINICFESQSAGAVLQVLEGTDYLTMLPYNVAKRLAKQNRIRILPFADRSPSRPIGIVMQANRYPVGAVLTLATFLRKRFT